MRIFYTLITLLFFTTLSVSSKGQTVGGYVDYRCLGQNRYEILVNLEEICGQAPNIPFIFFSAGTDTLGADSASFISEQYMPDFGLGCTTYDSCSLDSAHARIKLRTYRAVCDLSPYTDCRVSFGTIGFTSNFSDGTQNRQRYYLETYVNRCAVPCDTFMPQRTEPKIVVKNNLNSKQEYGISAKPGEFHKYRFTEAKERLDQSVTYLNGFNAYRWTSFLGFPNNNLPKPAGLHIDTLSGTVEYRPTLNGQSDKFQVVIETRRFKQINGVDSMIGFQRREHAQYTLLTNNNNLPGLANNNLTSGCAGDTITFTVNTFDLDSLDQLSLTFLNPTPEMLITHSGGLSPSMTIKWPTDTSMANNNPYRFDFKIEDNSCPINNIRYASLSVYVKAKVQYSSQIIPDSNCGLVNFSLTPAQNYPGLNIGWYLRDSTNNQLAGLFGLNQQYQFKPGKYYLTQVISGSNYCTIINQDSFIVGGSPMPDYVLNQRFRRGCIDSDDTIGVIQAAGNYQYTWQDGNTDPFRPITLGTDTTQYTLTISDGNCSATEVYTIQAAASINLNIQKTWITQDSLKLEVLNPAPFSSVKWEIQPINLTLNGNPAFAFLNQDSTYNIYIESSSAGCTSTGSIIVSPPLAVANFSKENIRVYPNPFQQELIIEGNEIVNLELYDLQGKQIRLSITKMGDLRFQMNTDKLQNGAYLLKVYTPEGVLAKRIIKY